jgi:hypothetical protein
MYKCGGMGRVEGKVGITEAGYGIRTGRSREIVERLERSIPGGNTRSLTYFPPYPLVISSGSGCRIWDADGNEFIDLLNNYTASVHGHALPAINEAMSKQAALGTVFPAPSELPVGTKGDAPTGSRRASPCAPSPLVVVFSKVHGDCVHFDQLEVVFLGGLRDAFSHSTPSAEGGHKRAVLAAQCDYVRVRLINVVVELGEHLLLHALSFTYFLRAFLHPLWATESSSHRCMIGGACYLAVN